MGHAKLHQGSVHFYAKNSEARRWSFTLICAPTSSQVRRSMTRPWEHLLDLASPTTIVLVVDELHPSLPYYPFNGIPKNMCRRFFRRALGLNTHKFRKRSAASLTDLPGLHLHLPELRLCLPNRINNGKAEQQWKGFRKRVSFLKTRTVILLYVSMLCFFFGFFFAIACLRDT